jgi:hypothetical protein
MCLVDPRHHPAFLADQEDDDSAPNSPAAGAGEAVRGTALIWTASTADTDCLDGTHPQLAYKTPGLLALSWIIIHLGFTLKQKL